MYKEYVLVSTVIIHIQLDTMTYCVETSKTDVSDVTVWIGDVITVCGGVACVMTGRRHWYRWLSLGRSC